MKDSVKGKQIIRIVVVDDESGTRSGVIRLIDRIDPSFVVVGEADNGYDGMLQIKELQPDVVIADIRMPRVNGLEMIENARNCSPHTRYLILSGYSEFELAKQAMRLSVVDYLLKPVTAAQLTDALHNIQRMMLNEADANTSSSTKTNTGNGFADAQNGAAYSPIVTHIIEGIRKDYARHLYLEDFAERLKITPEYAGSLFSRETGKTFSAYLRFIRMEKAKNLLQESESKIYEIAYKTGYADVKYFCRVFKDYTGVSAKSYARGLPGKPRT